MSLPDTLSRTTAQRLVSLDVLRGFDMCWILGLSDVVTKVLERAFPGNAAAQAIITQMDHVDWMGFRFYDLIFPLFLFLSGVSMSMALPKRLARDGRVSTVKHLLARAAIIFLLGVIYSGGLRNGVDGIRWLGVLQRIGIASAAAGMVSLWFGSRGLAASALALLLGYFAVMRFVPVPGVGAGSFAEGSNLANYVDQIWLPGHKYDGDHDPEGLLSTFPAIATALLGVLAGKWLSSAGTAGRKAVGLAAAGVVMLGLGWAWHPFFPVIKKIWTSSFVLVAGGWSALLLALFYWAIEGRGCRRGLTPFLWVGSNPIALYLCAGFGFFTIIGRNLTPPMVGEWDWVAILVHFLVMLATARFLHRRGIFLKV